MEKSPFARLSPELRNKIYESTLSEPEGCVRLNVESEGVFFDSCPPPELMNGFALTSTCKQIRSEALPLFFSSNRFTFHAVVLDKPHIRAGEERVSQVSTMKLEVIRGWFSRVGEGCKHINRISVYIGAWDTDDYLLRIPGVSDVMKAWRDVFPSPAASVTIEIDILWGCLRLMILELLISDVANARAKLQSGFNDTKRWLEDVNDRFHPVAADDLQQCKRSLLTLFDSLEERSASA